MGADGRPSEDPPFRSGRSERAGLRTHRRVGSRLCHCGHALPPPPPASLSPGPLHVLAPRPAEGGIHAGSTQGRLGGGRDSQVRDVAASLGCLLSWGRGCVAGEGRGCLFIDRLRFLPALGPRRQCPIARGLQFETPAPGGDGLASPRVPVWCWWVACARLFPFWGFSPYIGKEVGRISLLSLKKLV